MNTTQSTETRKANLFAKASTTALVGAALMIDAKGQDATGEERLSRAWIYQELETRMGGIQDEDAFDALLDQVTYTEALLVMFPALVA